MNFQNVNPLNVRLNKISGNLLPMTSDGGLFPLAWRVYGATVLLIEVIQCSVMVAGITFVSTEKVLQDGTAPIVIATEAIFVFVQLYARRGLISQIIGKLNDMLRVEDKTMENVVRSAMKSVGTLLKYYWIIGALTAVVWYIASTISVMSEKTYFFYEDYRIPLVLSKQPFSVQVLLLGNTLGLCSTVLIFIRKNAVDIYMINILLLMTAQYRYTAVKLATILQERIPQSHHHEARQEYRPGIDLLMLREMKALCRHHHSAIQITRILKKVLSWNFSMIYLTNVFRFCFLGVMFITALSSSPMDAALVVVYGSGGLLQFYILCSCVHHLLEASTEITDKAFHEKWYHLELSLKRTFLLIILSNNLECKLSKFEMFNLTLPSFMTTMNQAYSIALLFLRMK